MTIVYSSYSEVYQHPSFLPWDLEEIINLLKQDFS